MVEADLLLLELVEPKDLDAVLPLDVGEPIPVAFELLKDFPDRNVLLNNTHVHHKQVQRSKEREGEKERKEATLTRSTASFLISSSEMADDIVVVVEAMKSKRKQMLLYFSGRWWGVVPLYFSRRNGVEYLNCGREEQPAFVWEGGADSNAREREKRRAFWISNNAREDEDDAL